MKSYTTRIWVVALSTVLFALIMAPVASLAGEEKAAAPSDEPNVVEASEPTANTPVVKDEFDKTPRNAPCPCGSGKKFKHCHGR